METCYNILPFFVIGGFAEAFVMHQALVRKNRQPIKKSLKAKIVYGFLWVHGIVYFIEKTSTNIYDHKKLGYIPLTISYFIMFLYVAIVFFLLEFYSQLGTLVYLVPVVTNIAYALKYKYLITSRK